MSENKEKTVASWRDVRISVELPLYLIVDFLNSLNQRLSNIEDLVQTKDEQGNLVTFTEMYKKQAKADLNEKVGE